MMNIKKINIGETLYYLGRNPVVVSFIKDEYNLVSFTWQDGEHGSGPVNHFSLEFTDFFPVIRK